MKATIVTDDGIVLPLRVNLIQRHDELDKGRYRLVLDGFVHEVDMVDPPIHVVLTRSEFKEMLGLFFFGLEDDDIYLTTQERASGRALGDKLEAILEGK